MVVPSNHFSKRIRERAHIPKKATTNFISKAVKNGLYIENIRNNSLRSYMQDTVKEGYYGIIYGRYLVIISEDTNVGITILNLPKPFYKIVDKIKFDKKGDKQNEKRKRNSTKKYSPGEWEKDFDDYL